MRLLAGVLIAGASVLSLWGQGQPSTALLHVLTARPKVPHMTKGICPFEKCKYGEWTSGRLMFARRGQNRKSAVVFRIRPKEHFTAITGDVITRRFGVIRLRRTLSLPAENMTILAGSTLYTLYEYGEGETLFWFNGTFASADLYGNSVHAANDDYPWDTLLAPVYDWWLQVRNRNGIVGWVLNPSEFSDAGSD